MLSKREIALVQQLEKLGSYNAVSQHRQVCLNERLVAPVPVFVSRHSVSNKKSKKG
jgi:hypothetical protein